MSDSNILRAEQEREDKRQALRNELAAITREKEDKERELLLECNKKSVELNNKLLDQIRIETKDTEFKLNKTNDYKYALVYNQSKYDLALSNTGGQCERNGHTRKWLFVYEAQRKNITNLTEAHDELEILSRSIQERGIDIEKINRQLALVTGASPIPITISTISISSGRMPEPDILTESIQDLAKLLLRD
jgi:hypothetical protein